MRRRLPVLALLALGLAAPPAAAHIALTSPPPRSASLKAGPCGGGPLEARGDVVSTFQGGETIVVRWTETVDHPGHYRISFDGDGQDDFGDPASFEDLYSNPAVLIDGIADESGSNVMYAQEIKLPAMSCDNCTLQVVQVMTDKAPYGDGNDLYYQCADLVLDGVVSTTNDPSELTTGATGDATDTDSETTVADPFPSEGCGCRGAPPGAADLLLVPLLALGRRRRSP